MKTLSVSIRLLSPLCLSERRAGGQFRPSLDYIPGRVLRASLAHFMLEEGLGQSDLFQRLFHHPEGAMFHDAVPGQRTPVTALTCKTQGGFTVDGGHGILDSLVARTAFRVVRPPGLLPRFVCPECQSQMKQISQFYREGEKGPSRVALSQRILTRVALNRRRYAAEEGMLYSPFVLEEFELPESPGSVRDRPVRLTGGVRVQEDLLEEVARRLEALEWLGSGTGRGLGRVRISVSPQTRAGSSLTDRLRDFNQQLQETIRGLAPTATPDGESLYFSLTLEADALLSGPTREAPLPALRSWLKEIPDCEPIAAFAQQGILSGWCTAWGLPRPNEVAVRAGSVFVFRGRQAGLSEALARLEEQGVGYRRQDGFGQVRVCAEFHIAGKGDRL